MRRLREYPSPGELKQMYARPHESDSSIYHKTRIEATVAMLHGLIVGFEGATHRRPVFADLSCGDANIARAVALLCEKQWLGDLAPGYEITGPIEETIHKIPYVDIFVCSETLEHVAHPQELLNSIWRATSHLVMSTPLDEKPEDDNPEHVWSWDQADIAFMLSRAGFTRCRSEVLHLKQYGCHYDFQIWVAS